MNKIKKTFKFSLPFLFVPAIILTPLLITSCSSKTPDSKSDVFGEPFEIEASKFTNYGFDVVDGQPNDISGVSLTLKINFLNHQPYAIITKVSQFSCENFTLPDEIKIPEKVYNQHLSHTAYKLNSVGDSSEEDKTVDIPLKVIADGCFEENETNTNTGLTGKLKIGGNIELIGKNAFKNCNKIDEIVIGKNVVNIGSEAFAGCAKVSKLEFAGAKAPSFGQNVFKGINYGEEIIISCSNASNKNEVEGEIKKNLASNSDSGDFNIAVESEAAAIPSVPTWDEDQTAKKADGTNWSGFNGVGGEYGLESKNNSAPDNTVTISRTKSKKYSAYNLIIPKIVNVEPTQKTVTIIGDSTFANANGVTLTGTLKLPSSLKNIGASAFKGQDELIGTLVIPKDVTEIGESAFAGCSNLETLFIPSSIQTIGESAFTGCTNLKNVYFYKNTENTSSDMNIGKNAFKWCINLNGYLTIPSSVTSIGDNAFYGCHFKNILNYSENFKFAPVGQVGTAKVLIANDSVGKSIYGSDSNQAKIAGCLASGSLTIPNDVTTIPAKTFAGCGGLTKVNLNQVEMIKASSFADCWGIENVEIPSTVTDIDDYAFAGCKLINIKNNSKNFDFLPSEQVGSAKVLIKKHATNNNIYAASGADGYAKIAGCLAIGVLEIPNGIPKIHDSTFKGCSGLTSVSLNNVTEIGDSAFEGCAGLTGEINFNKVTKFGNLAFGWCAGLTGLSFGNAESNEVFTIAQDSFKGCNNVELLVFDENCIHLNQYICTDGNFASYFKKNGMVKFVGSKWREGSSFPPGDSKAAHVMWALTTKGILYNIDSTDYYGGGLPEAWTWEFSVQAS